MSDLHCPATLLLAPYDEGAGHTDAGTRRLVERAGDYNVARIYGGTGSHVGRTMRSLEDALRTAAEQRPELDDEDVVTELSAIADLHRGETVIVLLSEAAVETTLDALVGRRARQRIPAPIHYGSMVEVAADADGWVLRSPAPRTHSVPDLVPDREIRDVRPE